MFNGTCSTKEFKPDLSAIEEIKKIYADLPPQPYGIVMHPYSLEILEKHFQKIQNKANVYSEINTLMGLNVGTNPNIPIGEIKKAMSKAEFKEMINEV